MRVRGRIRYGTEAEADVAPTRGLLFSVRDFHVRLGRVVGMVVLQGYACVAWAWGFELRTWACFDIIEIEHSMSRASSIEKEK